MHNLLTPFPDYLDATSSTNSDSMASALPGVYTFPKAFTGNMSNSNFMHMHSLECYGNKSFDLNLYIISISFQGTHTHAYIRLSGAPFIK